MKPMSLQDDVIVGTNVQVTERVTVAPSVGSTHLIASAESWGWEQLRDYVVSKIEDRFGSFPRETQKEYGIFTAFVARWGAQASAIARYAFETCDGVWRGAPISVNRFCKRSDPYFAIPIAEMMLV
jgi:hypothetical protein